MPREKQKVYQYDSNGKYLRSYESRTELQEKYNLTKDALIVSRNGYKKLEDGTYVAFFRIGKDELLKRLKIENCPFCTTGGLKRKPVEVFNLLGEKIAEFTSIAVAAKMLNLKISTIKSRAKGQFRNVSGNLIFKYKK